MLDAGEKVPTRVIFAWAVNLRDADGSVDGLRSTRLTMRMRYDFPLFDFFSFSCDDIHVLLLWCSYRIRGANLHVDGGGDVIYRVGSVGVILNLYVT